MQLFGDIFFERGFSAFYEGIIVTFKHLEEIIMGDFRYDGGFSLDMDVVVLVVVEWISAVFF